MKRASSGLFKKIAFIRMIQSTNSFICRKSAMDCLLPVSQHQDQVLKLYRNIYDHNRVEDTTWNNIREAITMYEFVKTIAAIPVGELAEARLKSIVLENGVH
jgi:hypothetical protein